MSDDGFLFKIYLNKKAYDIIYIENQYSSNSGKNELLCAFYKLTQLC